MKDYLLCNDCLNVQFYANRKKNILELLLEFTTNLLNDLTFFFKLFLLWFYFVFDFIYPVKVIKWFIETLIHYIWNTYITKHFSSHCWDIKNNYLYQTKGDFCIVYGGNVLETLVDDLIALSSYLSILIVSTP